VLNRDVKVGGLVWLILRDGRYAAHVIGPTTDPKRWQVKRLDNLAIYYRVTARMLKPMQLPTPADIEKMAGAFFVQEYGLKMAEIKYWRSLGHSLDIARRLANRSA